MPRILSRGALGPSQRTSSRGSLSHLPSAPATSSPSPFGRAYSVGLFDRSSARPSRPARRRAAGSSPHEAGPLAPAGVRFPSARVFQQLEEQRQHTCYEEEEDGRAPRVSSCFSLFGGAASRDPPSGVWGRPRTTRRGSSSALLSVFRTSFQVKGGWEDDRPPQHLSPGGSVPGAMPVSDDGSSSQESGSLSHSGSSSSSPHRESATMRDATVEEEEDNWGFFIDVAAGERQMDEYEKFYPRRRMRP